MRSSLIILFISIFFNAGARGQEKSKIVVLGVTHSMQLVNPKQQPAILRTFFDRVDPKALCIESTPEQYLQSNFYEFTYEQQFCLIPYAKKKNIPIHPFDWWPENEDMRIALGFTDAEYPAFTRRANGFQGFLYFEDSSIFKNDLYYAENEKEKKEISDWYVSYPAEMQYDFPRRLFLYRTFLQAMYIKKTAEQYPGDTILAVVGSYHKEDLEKILGAHGFTIIDPKGFGQFTSSDVDANFLTEDAYAIASFNLLGLQSTTVFRDSVFLKKALSVLEKERTAETKLFSIRYKLLYHHINSAQAIEEYRKVLTGLSKENKFTWTGVKNMQRIDSYFDPFGNMTVWQRSQLELAREYFATGDRINYTKTKEILENEFTGLKKSLLREYMKIYLEK